MSNPEFGFNEMAPSQNQPEVVINAADRAMTKAMAGEAVINFASDADYTLDDDEWSRKVIRMTDSGVVLTTSRSVIFPDIDPLTARPVFVFVNATARSLTIKGDATSATGVTVAAGSEALVRFNGTDVVSVAASAGGSPVVVQLACSDLSSPLTEASSVAYFRAAQAFTLTSLRASLLIASDNGDIEIDIKKNGVSILTDPILIEQSEKTSTTASSQPSIDDDEIGDDDEISVDITDIESGTSAAGLIVTLIGTAS